MRFYKQQHRYYCGIDLHARKMYVCIINHNGKVKVHKNIKTDSKLFFELVFPWSRIIHESHSRRQNQRWKTQAGTNESLVKISDFRTEDNFDSFFRSIGEVFP